MKVNKIFLITIVLLAALSISTVSAEDIATNDSISTVEDTVAVENVQTSDSIASDVDTVDEVVDDNEVEDVSSEPANTTITAENSSAFYKENQSYNVELKSNDTPLANQTINFLVDNESIANSTTNDLGIATLNITFLPGTYDVIANYAGNENFTASSASMVINVNSVVADDIELYYKNGTKFVANFVDANGNALTNSSVQFKVNGVPYTRTTNENGTAFLTINLPVGNYSVTTTNLATNESIVNNITVLSTVSAKDVVKYYKNGTQYYVTVVDGEGNPITNTNVTMNINGVMYNRTTNENGTAKLNINLPVNSYVITVINPVNNQTYSNNITVLSTISTNSVNGTLVKYYKNGTQYYVTVVDGEGNPITNTNVTMNINGVMYNRTTNENGTAKLNINLNPGNYTITVYNPINNEAYSDKINVLSLIESKDYTTTYQTGGKFTVKIVDGQGNAAPNQNISMNVNGRIYYRTTDENGTASLNINLNPGTYTITTDYNGLKKSDKITVNKRSATISILNSTVKQWDYFKAKLSYNSQPITNTLLLFVYNNTAYGSYTNSEGIAQFRIGLEAGQYQIIVGIQDNTYYQNVATYTTMTVVA